jgi:hypothetical protein
MLVPLSKEVRPKSQVLAGVRSYKLDCAIVQQETLEWWSKRTEKRKEKTPLVVETQPA